MALSNEQKKQLVIAALKSPQYRSGVTIMSHPNIYPRFLSERKLDDGFSVELFKEPFDGSLLQSWVDDKVFFIYIRPGTNDVVINTQNLELPYSITVTPEDLAERYKLGWWNRRRNLPISINPHWQLNSGGVLRHRSEIVLTAIQLYFEEAIQLFELRLKEATALLSRAKSEYEETPLLIDSKYHVPFEQIVAQVTNTYNTCVAKKAEAEHELEVYARRIPSEQNILNFITASIEPLYNTFWKITVVLKTEFDTLLGG